MYTLRNKVLTEYLRPLSELTEKPFLNPIPYIYPKILNPVPYISKP